MIFSAIIGSIKAMLFLLTNTPQKTIFWNKFSIKGLSSDHVNKSADNAKFVHICWRNTLWETSKSSKFTLEKCVFYMT